MDQWHLLIRDYYSFMPYAFLCAFPINTERKLNMAKPNYRQVYARKLETQKRIKTLCDNITNESGIYIFTRVDEQGIKYAYVGQAVHLLDRCASHLLGYQHIDLSIKKHGLYSEKNPYGYKLGFVTCDESLLDIWERQWIIKMAKGGYQMRNATLGGQDEGKVVIDSKPPKGYRDGLKQGYENAKAEIKELFDKYLDFSIKNGTLSHKKDGSIKEIFLKKYQEFGEFLGRQVIKILKEGE